jgi:Cu2+-exporting ATPase
VSAAPCRHCGVPTTTPDRFCCSGCRVARAMISASGLEDFYRQRSGAGVVAAPPGVAHDAAWCDGESFARAHVRALPGGLALARWRVEGLTCGACVWLLERLPRLHPGVRACRVDLGAETLDLAYDPAACPPSTQAALVAGLGYRLRAATDGDGRAQRLRARRDLALRAAVAAGSAVASMHLALNLVAGELAGDLGAAQARWFAWLALAAAIPACVWSAWPLHRTGWSAARAGRIGADAAASAVVLLALVSGTVVAVTGEGRQYADAAAMFVALLLGGRLAYACVKDRALGRAGALEGIVPDCARRLGGIDDAVGALVAADDLAVGDLVAVAEGERLPADGVLVGPGGFIDAAVLTGESAPCAVREGDEAWAGSVCRAARLMLRVRAVGAATRVGGLLAAARTVSPASSGIAERVQAWFLPGLLALVGATWAWWHAHDPARALDQAVAMALVCCPCAVGLAAPLALAIATARAGRRGLVLRDAAALERLAHATDVVFDKTGTLTVGAPAVAAWTWHGDGERWAPWLLAAAQRSRHPAATAVVRHLRAAGIVAADLGAAAWREEPGRGVACATPAGEVRLGSATFHGGPGAGASLAGVALATWALADALKPGAAEMVSVLAGRGARLHLLSGDRPEAVADAAAALGFDPGRAVGGCSPEDKAARIDALRRSGGVVVMVGDGVNDAAALARADAGVGLRGGLAAALAACSVYALRDEPAAILELFDGALAVRATLRRCLAVGLAYNFAGAALVLTGAIGPLVCAALMPLGSLTVLAVAWRSQAFAEPHGGGLAGAGRAARARRQPASDPVSPDAGAPASP